MSQENLDLLLEQLKLKTSETGGTLQIIGSDPVVASPHKLGEASATALAAQGACIAAIWKMRSGRGQNVSVNLQDAVHGLHTLTYMKQHGHPISLHVVKEAITDFHRCADGRWIFTTCSYPHLKDGVLDVLRCQNAKFAISNAVSKWNGQDLEDALNEHGLAAGLVRSKEEWHAHPQGRHLLSVPPIEITKIADTEPMPLAPAARPLSGIRVLDMTHVIAGPLLARTLAEQGADVLHISQSNHDDPQAMVMEVGHGKRNAYIDFDRSEDMMRLNQLICDADIFVNSWRPGSIEHHGFSPGELARKRPGIIYVQESAYGLTGPWSSRAGFDQQGQSVTGIAAREGGIDGPRLAPVYYLNDFITGYLGAAGALAALILRSKEGGSYHVKVALARSSMWVQSLGYIENLDPQLPLADNLGTPPLAVSEGPYGELEFMKPITQYSETQGYWDKPPAPLGAHKPEWL